MSFIRSIALLALSAAATLQAEEFSLRVLDFGPIVVRTSIWTTSGGATLTARAINGTEEPVQSLKLCVRSDEVKGCLFEVISSNLDIVSVGHGRFWCDYLVKKEKTATYRREPGKRGPAKCPDIRRV